MHRGQAWILPPTKARKVEVANGGYYRKVTGGLKMSTKAEGHTAGLIVNVALLSLIQCIAVLPRHSESPLTPQFDKFLLSGRRTDFRYVVEKVFIANLVLSLQAELSVRVVKLLCHCLIRILPFLLLPPVALESMYQELMTIRKLELHDPVNVDGDVIFIDPLKIFFEGSIDGEWFRQLQDWECPNLHTESSYLLIYHGFPMIFATCSEWDSDLAFEITRNGKSLGIDTAPSRVIAVVPKKFVVRLMNENDLQLDLDTGVAVQGVKGVLEFSRDGDFKIRDTSGDRSVASNASVICQTGGSWTTCGETSSDDEEDDKEVYLGLED